MKWIIRKGIDLTYFESHEALEAHAFNQDKYPILCEKTDTETIYRLYDKQQKEMYEHYFSVLRLTLLHNSFNELSEPDKKKFVNLVENFLFYN